MEPFLLVVVSITLFVRWLVLSGKMNEIQQKLDVLAGDQTHAMLTQRVYALEQAVKELRVMRPAEVPVTPPPSIVVDPEPAPVIPEPVVPEPVVREPEPPPLPIPE